MLPSSDKQVRFEALAESARHCTLCPRMCNRTRVLSTANGSLAARVMFVAEAPGRLGADRTGIPLFGDRTGDNFQLLLDNIGWRREHLFITNALLCNPREESGNNSTPTLSEIANCSKYLQMTIDLVGPDVVVALGATALRALDLLGPHGIGLRDGVGKPVPWLGRVLVPFYHPGPRALIHRGLAKQRSDYLALASLVDPVRGLKRRRTTSTTPLVERSPVHELVRIVVDQLGSVTYFKLMKLLYLIDHHAKEAFGHTLTGGVYLRQQEGPWSPAVRDAVRAMEGFEIRTRPARGGPCCEVGPSPRFRAELTERDFRVVCDVLERYKAHSNAAMKTAVYLTEPMRRLLRAERVGTRTLNQPVLEPDAVPVPRPRRSIS